MPRQRLRYRTHPWRATRGAAVPPVTFVAGAHIGTQLPHATAAGAPMLGPAGAWNRQVSAAECWLLLSTCLTAEGRGNKEAR